MEAEGGERDIPVAIVEDEAFLRDLLRLTLSQQPRLVVAGVFGSVEAALDGVLACGAQVAILDIDLGGGLSGIQLGMLLRERNPRLGIVLLSNHWVPSFIAALPPQVMAGWCYLLKKSLADVDTLARAVEGAARGLVVLDPYVVAGRRPRQGGVLAELTSRQREVLALVAQGFTNAAIAQRLSLAPRAVENVLNHVYQALQLRQGESEFNPRVQATLLYLLESRAEDDGRALSRAGG